MMRQFQTISCGDGELDPTEECDYGDTTPWDGCSAKCHREQYVELAGLAQGGGAQMTIAGVVVSVPTSAGQTPAQVAAALAAAINSNPALMALGIMARANGDRVFVNGTIGGISFGDPGLDDRYTLTMTPGLLWWASVPAATGYDLVRGDLSLLQSSAGDFTTATQACMANNVVPTSLAFTATPPVSQGWWFLLRAATPGGPGTYDDGSPSQVGSRDAEINAAAASCP
jgi:cysteine-rich repeat protein